MLALSPLCISLLLAVSALQQAPVGGVSQTLILKPIVSKIGVTISLPSDIGSPVFSGPAAKPSEETYALRSVAGCNLQIARKTFSKDETPESSTASKLEDAIYDGLDLDEDRISKITFFSLNGWPAVDVEGKKKDETLFRTRVCRTKTLNYVLSLSGKTLPDADIAKAIFESFHPPKESGVGKLTKWGPEAQKSTLEKAKLEIWTPVKLVDSDDVPDFTGDDVEPIGFAGEFGYSSYNIAFVQLPESMAEQYDEDALDKLIKGKYARNDDGENVEFGDFKTYRTDDVVFRTVNYVDGTAEGRVDVAVKNGRLYVFAVLVPRGMIGSEDAKHFFSSIVLK